MLTNFGGMWKQCRSTLRNIICSHGETRIPSKRQHTVFFVNWCKHLEEDCKIHASLTKHGELRTRPSQVGAIAWRSGGWNGWEMPCYWGDDEGWNLSSLTDRRFNYIHLRFVSRNEEVLQSANNKKLSSTLWCFFRATSSCYLYKVVQNIPILNPSAVDSWGLFHLAALGRAWPSLACRRQGL